MNTHRPRWTLPKHDYWSTPFAESLLQHLDLRADLKILDIASGHGIPAFYLAEQVGPAGAVRAIDISAGQVARARAIQGSHLPWLHFECADMRALPPDLPMSDRITGNLSVMFFRPHRFEGVRELVERLNPGGQLVLTFPSYGTFDSLWQRVDHAMVRQGLTNEQERFHSYLNERPSAQDGRGWLGKLDLERVEVMEYPLEVETGPGQEFLYHPLLRGGFLDDVYECFEDQSVADRFMIDIAQDITLFTPLIAQRCVLSGWKRTASADCQG
ncbi:MAG: class I SAM-dependent methyltransferase [Nitrospira sp.]|nr:class I SAM-dependent methyltransferase [Nitrospira sp.]